MSAANERLEFAPPRPPGQLRSFGLAVLAHLLLLAALTWGVSWKRQTLTLSADAELWAAVPKEAAPKEVEAPPPEPTPIPKFLPKVTLPPPPPPPPPPVEAETAKADIVLAQEKERKRQLELKAVERQEKLKKEKLEKESAALEKKRQLAEAKQEAQRVEALRQENVKRNLAMARALDALGVPGSGTAVPPQWVQAMAARDDLHAAALLRAALRESQEESGWRWADGSLTSLDGKGLRYLGRAITPAQSPRRFHARFFAVPQERMLQDPHADGELLDLRWVDAHNPQRLPIIDVTEFMLDELQRDLAGKRTGWPLLSYVNDVVRIRRR